MDNERAAELILDSVKRIRENVEKRLDEYATERDWQKLRTYEMADIAAEEAAIEMTQLVLNLRNEGE